MKMMKAVNMRTAALRGSVCRPSRVGRGALNIRAAANAVPSQFGDLKPVGGRVFVKVGQAEQETTSGLLLPTTAVSAPTQGKVVASDGDNVKIGDNVVYGKYAGTEIALGGVEHILLKEEDVIGTMDSPSVAKMKPMGDRILVEIAQAADSTSGGVLLTGPAEKPTLGKVVAVGPGGKDAEGKAVPVNTKVGATILYSKYSGTEFEGEDEMQYIVIREADVLAELA